MQHIALKHTVYQQIILPIPIVYREGKTRPDTNYRSITIKFDNKHFQTKTEAEVASEKEWLEAEKVWVVHKGGFSGGRMLKSSPATANAESDTTRKVKLDHGGEIMNIDEDSVEKVCWFLQRL